MAGPHYATRTRSTLLPATCALGVSAVAEAGLVQRTLTGNELNLGGNSLNADLTGDLLGDIGFSNTLIDNIGDSQSVQVNIGGLLQRASGTIATTVVSTTPSFIVSSTTGARVTASGGQGLIDESHKSFFGIGASTSAKNFVSGNFTDVSINGGASTPFRLEFTVSSSLQNGGPYDMSIALDRIVFDHAAQPGGGGIGSYVFGAAYSDYVAVPEPHAPALALLAAGAIGVTSRRRSQRSSK